jgi:hypothetical protein
MRSLQEAGFSAA